MDELDDSIFKSYEDYSAEQEAAEQAEAIQCELDEHVQEEIEHYRDLLTSAETIHDKHYSTQRYLIGPAVLPRKGKMLITAETGIGKSTLSLHIAACLATGSPLFGLVNRKKEEDFGKPLFPVEQHNFVAYLDYEIPEQLRQPRIRALKQQFPGDWMRNLGFFKNSSDYRLINERGAPEGKGSFDRLFHYMTQAKPDVLIVDPFSSTHSLNEISNEIKQPLNNLDRIIDHADCAVILIHHSSTKQKDDRGKPTTKRVQEQPRGHSSILDWADSHLHISDVSEGQPTCVRTLKLEWGKMRYDIKPRERHISLNFQTMEMEPFLF